MTLVLKSVPSNLHEALIELESELTTVQRREIQRMSRQQASGGLGPLLNPEWRLSDPESPLVQWFGAKYGLQHSHDTSRLIMDALWSRVQRTPNRTAALAAVFRKEWEILGRDPWTMEPRIPASPTPIAGEPSSPAVHSAGWEKATA